MNKVNDVSIEKKINTIYELHNFIVEQFGLDEWIYIHLQWMSVLALLTIMIFSNMKAVCPAASLSSLLSLLFSSCRARFLSTSCVTFSVDSGLQQRNRETVGAFRHSDFQFEISPSTPGEQTVTAKLMSYPESTGATPPRA